MIRKDNILRLLGAVAFGLLLQGFALTAVAAPAFSVTPYLQHPATNAMTILFFTTEDCTATVKWWRADGKGVTNSVKTTGTDVSSVFAKNSQASSSGSDKDYVAFSKQYKYRVRLDTLRTYTDYCYEVRLGDAAAEGSGSTEGSGNTVLPLPQGQIYKNVFRTFPDRNTPIRFVGYSDSETVPEADADTVTWITHQGSKTYPVKRREGYATNLVYMVSRQPDLITISGDLAAKGGWQKNWDEFWKQNAGEYGDPAGSIPILAAIGNHDLKDKSSSISGSTGGESALEKYLTYFEYNPNGVEYTYTDGTTEKEDRDLSQLFHREDLGPVTLIFLDTNKGAKGSDKKKTTQTNSDRPPMRSPDFNPGSLQYTWLTNNLADAQRKSRFTFVFNHHCPYSSGKHNSTSDSECAQAVRNLTPAMIKYGVDGWLCGHDEIQEHSQTNGLEVLPNGTTRPHTLNIFALGSGGDSVKHGGEESDSVENPLAVFRAYKDDPDTWSGDTLVAGGVHYGHIEVDVTTNRNGKWMCSLTPVYSFISNDKKTYKRCCYSDRVILQELPIDETSGSADEIVYQQAPRFPVGTGVPSDYVEYERPPQMADPVDPPEPPTPPAEGSLRISEICPKPQMACKTDSTKLTDATDPNGVVAGWIELENRGTESVDLSAYKLVVANRGKKLKTDDFSNLPTKTLAAGARVVIYTTKDYSSDGDLMFKQSFMNENETRAFVKGEAAGIVEDEIVLATKVNPKKFPMVRLLKGSNVVDSVIVPADLPDNASVVVQDPGSDGATLRYLTTHPTCGTANDLTDAVKLGPNVGPLYGVKHSFSDLDPVPPATSGQDYEISLDVNPVDAANAKDAIKSVTLVYRTHANAVTSTCQRVTMTSNSWDAAHGITWKAPVPKGKLPAKGMLLQWRAEIKDVAGNTWTSPAFNGKEAGYEWYGTIVDPGVGDGAGQNSATLPTWHMFAVEGDTSYPLTDKPGKSATRGDNCLMNLDYDETYEYPASKDTDKKKAYRSRYPYGARIAIYDAETSNYYDNVRIDCRGNSSDDYYKRSHGLKFSKIKAYRLATPYVHPVSGIEVDEISKTSLCAEYNDPAMFRQRLSFWFMNTVGVHAPWENPKRVNLNGAFYQFAYESPRFNDELLCDIYGFDARGSGYKNVGTFHTGTGTDDYGKDMGTTASAGTKRKTPDDGNEKDFAVLTAFFDEIKAAGNVKSDKTGKDTTGLDNATLTATVVEKFDLPAWINYLAATRITQEGDDVWGNLGGYYDSYTLLDGTVCGTGTWRPLAWDMNCSWGQYYFCHLSGQSRAGLHANKDWNKCHPLYGGMRILAYQQPGATSSFYAGSKGANYAIESVFQSTKFRRLFLRRLRTLMDTYLMAPDTAKESTPIAVQMQAYANEVLVESQKDRGVWGHLGTTSGNKDCDWVNCWGTTLMSAAGYQPDDPSYGVTDIWENYIGPRRTHLFTTHAAGTGKTTGYGLNVCAGIPAKQSAITSLREKITVQYDADLGAVVIKNTKDETIDLSGWKLTGPVEMTLPPGTVLDQGTDTTPGEVYVAADRRATIAKMTLKDQVVIGNGVTNAATTVRLADATGEPVVPYTVTVTTAADGIGTVSGGGEYEVGANVTLTATPATGYRFTKWTLDDASESKENPLVLENLRRSVGATATFKANEYTIAYGANGGAGEEIPEGTATYDKKYETADCSFTKTGYTCTGWGTNGVGGLVFVCKPGKKVQNLSAENKATVTLHAMWEPIAYSLVYAPGEATGVAVTNKLSYDEAHVVIDCPFKLEGFAFVGWDDGEVYHQPEDVVSNLTTAAGTVIGWTAQWEAASPVPVTEPESIQEIALDVGETIAITNTYRKNLRFWLFGSTRQSKVVEAELNLPYQDCESYVGYAHRTTVKTNEVVVTLRGVGKGEETVSFGRQYKMKEPVHAVSYRITVK